MARLPKTRQEFWIPKLEGNQVRDRKKRRQLRAAGWDLLVIWECEVKNKESVERAVRSFLGDTC